MFALFVVDMRVSEAHFSRIKCRQYRGGEVIAAILLVEPRHGRHISKSDVFEPLRPPPPARLSLREWTELPEAPQLRLTQLSTASAHPQFPPSVLKYNFLYGISL